LHTSDGELVSLIKLMIDLSLWNKHWGNLLTVSNTCDGCHTTIVKFY